ncbi:MAG: PDZ domain-containing protein [Gemmataceae bacterium]|nr:PDZ domain-containing protein [Gemmataceae bacterium]
MNELLSGVRGWWLTSAVGGGAVLLLTAIWMARTVSHRHRQRLGEWGILSAFLLVALRLAPAWITLPDPAPAAPAPACNTVVQGVPIDPVEVAFADAPDFGAPVADVPRLLTTAPSCEPPAAAAEPPASNWRDRVSLAINVLAVGYAAVAGFLLLRWALGLAVLARIVNRASPAPPSLERQFAPLAEQLGRPDARLLVSDRVGVPVCCGIASPTVIIPRSLVLKNDTDELRWVFAHELTHLARRDPWSMWALGLAQVMFFYLPWFWWMKRQVRLSQEYVADAAAAATGRWADEYAQFLVNFARYPSAPMAAAGVFETKSDLYRRVTMVLKPQGGAGSRRQLVSGLACLFAAAIVLAGLGVRAEAQPGSDEAKKDVRVTTDGKTIAIKVIADEEDKKDGDKKDREKQAEKKTRVYVNELAPMMPPGFDKAEFEKKLRKALSAAKLNDDDIEKIVKDALKGMDPIKVQGFPLAGLGDLKFDVKGTAPTIAGMAHMRPTGRLGVMVERPSPALAEQLELSKDQGLVLVEVIKGSSAEKAGLKTNDILLRFADKDVGGEAAKFIKLLDDIEAGKEVTAIVLRKGKKEKVEGIKLGEKVDHMKWTATTVPHVEVLKGDGPEKVIVREIAPGKGEGGNRIFMREIAPGSGNKEVKSTNKTVSVMIKDGEITAKESDGDLSIVVTGTVQDKKVTVKSVTIEEPGAKSSYTSLDKVPAKYKSRVEKLISNSGDSPVRFDSHKE